MLEVLVDGGVEVLGVALINTVDLPLLLDLHVPVSQDELADGLRNKTVMLEQITRLDLLIQLSLFHDRI